MKPPPGLTLYTNKETSSSAWARILLMGAKGVGKTTTVLTTSPRPVLVLNADDTKQGQSNALVSAAREGGEYFGVTVGDVASWNKSVRFALDVAKRGKVQTVVLDTLSLLSLSLVTDIAEDGAQGFDLYGELKEELVGGVRKLLEVDAHLIVTVHPLPLADGQAGVIPAVAGSAKVLIPPMFPDFIMMDYNGSLDPVRGFLVNPQGDWKYGSRNAKRSVRIKADIGELLGELGIEP